MEKAAPRKLQVVQADWLKPGWILAFRQFAFEATRIDVPRGDSPAFAQTVLNRLEQLRQTTGVWAIFLSQEDCALVTEHCPDAFYRNK